jgi:hypothetical protein
VTSREGGVDVEFPTQMLATGKHSRSAERRAHNLLNTGAMNANDRCDECERQVAMYANDRNRDGSGRRQTATLFKPNNGGGPA